MMSENENAPPQNIMAQFSKISRVYQQTLDRWTPHILHRWLAFAALIVVFFLRIVFAQGVSCSCQSLSSTRLISNVSGTSVGSFLESDAQFLTVVILPVLRH